MVGSVFSVSQSCLWHLQKYPPVSLVRRWQTLLILSRLAWPWPRPAWLRTPEHFSRKMRWAGGRAPVLPGPGPATWFAGVATKLGSPAMEWAGSGKDYSVLCLYVGVSVFSCFDCEWQF
jgi:hypothetical protein